MMKPEAPSKSAIKDRYQGNDASASCHVVWNMDVMLICVTQVIAILRDEPAIVNANRRIHGRSRRLQDLVDLSDRGR
jgi:hypothetical protein